MKKIVYGLIITMTLCVASVHAGPEKSDIYVFGDSLSDPGNAFVVTGEVSVRPFNTSNIPDAAYARGGHHFSNGETWIEQLSADLKLKGGSGPALRSPSFTNYAFGGARARANSGAPFDLATQVGLFLSDPANIVTTDTLFSVYVGGNDVRDALVTFNAVFEQTLLSGGTLAEALAAGQAAAEAVLADAVTAIADNIVALTTAGGRRFLVPNAPNVGAAPAVKALGADAAVLAAGLSDGFNTALNAALDGLEAALPIEIVRVDIFDLINQVVASPEAFGLVNSADACITPDVHKGAYCNKPDDYLFWDGIHPTRAGHALLANKAAEALLQ